MLHHLGGDDAIERAIRERQLQRIAVRRRHVDVGIGAGDVTHVLELGEIEVDCGDDRTAPGRLERVTAAAAPEVEYAVARP